MPGMRKILVVVVTVAVLAAAAVLLVDVGAAIRSEHRLARALAESPPASHSIPR